MIRFVLFFASLILCGLSPTLAQQPQTAPNTTQQTAPAQPKPSPAAPKPKTGPAKPKAVAQKKAAAPAAPEKARFLEKVKDWSLFLHEGSEGRVCFAATMPIDSMPKTLKRGAVIFYVTSWQKDGVRNEISIKQGYKLKPNVAPTATVNNSSFVLVSDGDNVFVKNTNDELKLIAAMSQGGVITVKGTSERGTVITDQYSLSGVQEALKKLNEACP